MLDMAGRMSCPRVPERMDTSGIGCRYPSKNGRHRQQTVDTAASARRHGHMWKSMQSRTLGPTMAHVENGVDSLGFQIPHSGDCGVSSTVVVDESNVAEYGQHQMASISRLAMYNSGATLGSHTAAVQMTRGSMYQSSNPGNIGVRGTRPMASAVSSIVVIAMTLGTALFAAIRSKLKAVRACASCQGYGVQRCKLCSGKGTIDWEGKMAHREPCPMCLGRRLIKCTHCGGGILFSRSLFIHKSNKGEEALMETLQTLTTPSMSQLFSSSKNRDVQQDARLAESDEYSKEILSD